MMIVLAAVAEAPPPLVLALEDYVPVVLSFLGLVYVARWLGVQRFGAPRTDHSGLALLAAVLIGVGGLTKATWKFVYAVGPDVAWLDELLFPMLATGFTVFAVLTARRAATDHDRDRAARLAGAGVVLVGVLLWGAVSFDAAEMFWLVTMVVASTTLVVLLVRASLLLGQRRAAVAFGVHLVVTFVLAGLARVPEQSWTLQWIEQLSNTVSQGLFLLASKWLFDAEVAAPPVTHPTTRAVVGSES